MTTTVKEYIDPNTGKPDDRAWLYDEIFNYVEAVQRAGKSIAIVPEDAIYVKFAPIGGWNPYGRDRKSWNDKPRKIKRDMIAATITRLIADGKLRVAQADVDKLRLRSLHTHVAQRDKVLGSKWSRPVRAFQVGSVLDAIVDAL